MRTFAGWGSDDLIDSVEPCVNRFRGILERRQIWWIRCREDDDDDGEAMAGRRRFWLLLSTTESPEQ
jgi:hypothetical protein